MTNVGVVNKSKRISSDEAQAMVLACQDQVFADFAPAYGMEPFAVTLYATEADVPKEAAIILLVETTDVPDALGWHTEDSKGRRVGQIAVAPSLDNGSTALTGEYPVSATLSHEVLETGKDECVNEWCVDGAGLCWSKEVSDPVEGFQYAKVVSVSGKEFTVPLSDFVKPNFFDPAVTTEVTNFVGDKDEKQRLIGAFQLAPGGYAVKGATPSTADQVFGEKMPTWRQDMKKHPNSRSEWAKRQMADLRNLKVDDPDKGNEDKTLVE